MIRKLASKICAAAAFGLLAAAVTAALASAVPRQAPRAGTTTPIKHVIVIIGENHSFDNVFATYRPPGHQHILNLMSEGIINPDGSPGPNFGKAAQLKASDKGAFSLTPTITGKYATLPAPNTTYVSKACDGLAGNSADTR